MRTLKNKCRTLAAPVAATLLLVEAPVAGQSTVATAPPRETPAASPLATAAAPVPTAASRRRGRVARSRTPIMGMMTERYPTISSGALGAANSRSLGVFDTEAQAVAAARAAGLASGSYGLAIAAGTAVAIAADGTVYLRDPGIADIPGATSRPGQRPPQ